MTNRDDENRRDWGESLRLFRARNGLKQEAAAGLLGVSQAYISRVENSSVTPSAALIQRLKVLERQPEHRPIIELIRTAVRHAPSLTCLLRLENGRLIIE